MFTLRIIQEERKDVNHQFQQVIENFEIGNSYSVLKNGATYEFDDLLIKKYPDSYTETNKAEISAIVCCENGLDFFIFKNGELRNFTYFIMTENGKTFERL